MSIPLVTDLRATISITYTIYNSCQREACSVQLAVKCNVQPSRAVCDQSVSEAIEAVCLIQLPYCTDWCYYTDCCYLILYWYYTDCCYLIVRWLYSGMLIVLQACLPAVAVDARAALRKMSDPTCSLCCQNRLQNRAPPCKLHGCSVRRRLKKLAILRRGSQGENDLKGGSNLTISGVTLAWAVRMASG